MNEDLVVAKEVLVLIWRLSRICLSTGASAGMGFCTGVRLINILSAWTLIEDVCDWGVVMSFPFLYV